MNVEKAARKELRLLKHKPEELRLVENNTQASVVAKHLLNKIFPDLNLDGTTELIPASRDELNTQFLTDFLEDRTTDFDSTFFLTTIPYSDLRAYAEKNNLAVRELVLDENERVAYAELTKLQAEQEQTMPSLRKTYGWMKEALKKE